MIRSRSIFGALAVCSILPFGCGKAPEPPAPSGPEAAQPVQDAHAADRAEAASRLKQIGTAISAAESVFGQYPAGIVGPKGQLGLSWRVLLLPLLGKEGSDLFRQFKQEEPWDSDHNKKLLTKMPKVYARVGSTVVDGKTHVRSFVGPQAFVLASAEAKPLLRPNLSPGIPAGTRRHTDLIDGTSNTLIVAEAPEPVEWTKPDDVPFLDDQYAKPPGAKLTPVPKLGGVFPGGFHGLMADGAVHFFPDTLAEGTLRALLTVNGGEVLEPDVSDMLHPLDALRAKLPKEVPAALADAAARKTVVANYQTLLKGMLDFHTARKYLPAGIASAKSVGLSWRVQILPFIGEQVLYQQFKLTEPWDSDANKALLEKMPKVFEAPGANAPKGHTFARTTQGTAGIVWADQDGPQPPPKVAPGQAIRGRAVGDIWDGTENTVLITEGRDAVPWTKPEELPVALPPGGPHNGAFPSRQVIVYDRSRNTPVVKAPPLGGVFPDGFHAVFGDGKVVFYKSDYPTDEIAKMLTPSSGEYPNLLHYADRIGYSIPALVSGTPFKSR
ncbi:Uncharacterized protein OS=Planctomyces maris DSM 8797 GN=PM8797T_27402 PE=4 SV=1: SBP_bac_10: SBP_bac_10 [Gemmata massiliana]|uniref:DUF1559 domain-containing protein n=1 Tax=Gemmata massiliana TaxID=1210884 RepID=A0A6P2D5M6_9BACT|nr:DUF1559 domain-containing protein [Gemmata massiliana]VTR96197.1 Uncharacterized protein OS=Planctomyces maris DSM 8797 GN=PM8797T_27402 PE=4 SV=1: SBP_bac_10: SBP_bac_10 [Gemmata massiliana]